MLDVPVVAAASYLLSVAWWATQYRGECGYAEVRNIRLVFKGVSLIEVAQANGIHRNDKDKAKAKAQLGHMCFDIAIQAAATQLQASWAICGGYALSCIKRRQAPYNKYRYVDELPNNPSVVRQCEFGDVDLFAINTVGAAWSEALTEDAVSLAFDVLNACFLVVAGYSGLTRTEAPSSSDDSSDESSDYPKDASLPLETQEEEEPYMNVLRVSGLRHFYVGSGLLGRVATLQLVLSPRPKSSPRKVVISFDMTQCAVWIWGLSMREGEPVLSIKMPCRSWMQDVLLNKGSRISGAGKWCPISRSLVLFPQRVAKYIERGYAIDAADVACIPKKGNSFRVSMRLIF